MKPPDSAILQKVDEWIAYAKEDLAFARHGLTMPKPASRSIAFHAQQCVEKALKAYLVYHGIDFPFTHNISRLLELAGELTSWLEDLKEAEELTPFATTLRYPGETLRVSEREAIRAVNIAEKTLGEVKKRFAQEGVKLSTTTK
jgi:HEPN domain-containing protein